MLWVALKSIEPNAAPSPDDAVAAKLRGSEPLGVDPIFVILAGNHLESDVAHLLFK